MKILNSLINNLPKKWRGTSPPVKDPGLSTSPINIKYDEKMIKIKYQVRQKWPLIIRISDKCLE